MNGILSLGQGINVSLLLLFFGKPCYLENDGNCSGGRVGMIASQATEPLTWRQVHEIAQALCHYYPDVERLDCTPEEVRQLIVALPEFSDTHVPPSRDVLDSILWQWMRLSNEDCDMKR